MWGLDAIVSGFSAASDYADDAVKFITGGLSTAGEWMQKNPGAATLLGSALVAGGSYLENREAQKNQRNMQKDIWGREDQLRQENGLPANLTPVEFQVTPGLAGDGMSTGGALTSGLLANIKKQGA
ncbi:hypothetical protein SL040_004659 [Aeromonas salmonicida]|nr:hypothetical protein [Aeromonas salmonicida]ELY2004350.1 hypothetical protein [Aeromonas salmonicida]